MRPSVSEQAKRTCLRSFNCEPHEGIKSSESGASNGFRKEIVSIPGIAVPGLAINSEPKTEDDVGPAMRFKGRDLCFMLFHF